MSFWDLVLKNEEEFRFWKDEKISLSIESLITKEKTIQETEQNRQLLPGQ
jgi:hypothetical protein